MTGLSKIYVAGHRGMVGSAIVRKLRALGQTNIVTRTRAEMDLTDQRAVHQFFAEEKPTEVYVAAARVGGKLMNSPLVGEIHFSARAGHNIGLPQGSKFPHNGAADHTAVASDIYF